METGSNSHQQHHVKACPEPQIIDATIGCLHSEEALLLLAIGFFSLENGDSLGQLSLF